MSDPFDAFGPERGSDGRPPSRWEGAAARGLLIVAVAVVLGAILLPSATRAPLAQAGTTPTTTPPATAAQGSGTTSTTRPATTTTLPGPATVHVLVANGTTVHGAAGSVTDFLGSKGYSTLSAVNATTPASSSAVYATGGSVPAALGVADALGLPRTAVVDSTSAPVSSTAGATVVVVVGTDLAQRFASGSTGTTSSTTAGPSSNTIASTTTTTGAGH
jgi:hypothetical protein